MRRLACISLLFILGSCARPAPEGATDDWMNPGGDDGKSHFSQLIDIDKSNVAQLGLAWSYDLGTNRVQEATPVVIDGVMYASGNLGRVYALDAVTGKEIWTFAPEVNMQVNRYACCDQANRGLSVAGDRLFVMALDGILYALDRKTGTILWKADTIADHKSGYTTSGAPEVAGNLVVMGNAGAEYGVRGYVTAYQIDTGKQAWRFFVTPRDPKLGKQETPDLDVALKTWDPKSRWSAGGGGTAWDAINYDRQFDTVIVGTGNGGPYAASNRSPAGGSNLYLSSLVALDRLTGRIKWFYQETPEDSWDFTAVQPMVLTTITIDGRERPVIIHAPKNGLIYVIDRETGKPLHANPLVYVNWMKGIDRKTGAPILNRESADYGRFGPKIVFPATPGARNWQPGAWDKARGLYFAPVTDMGNLLFFGGEQRLKAQTLNTETSVTFNSDLLNVLPGLPPAVRAAVEKSPELARVKRNAGRTDLRAIDPLTGRTRWSVPMDGWNDKAGVLATASGLVFQGRLSGKFNVYDANNGHELKSIETGRSIMAAPMTFRVNGVQYVAVATGWGGGGWPYVPTYSAAYSRGNSNCILVFRIGGTQVAIPPLLPPVQPAVAPPRQEPGVTRATIDRGRTLFFQNCAICHANEPRSMTPDLRRLTPAMHMVFDKILLDGLLVPAGMPRWDDVLEPSDIKAIHAFLKDEQAQLHVREVEMQKRGQALIGTSKAVLSAY